MHSVKSSPFINMEKGLIHIYTGSGKGKTSAAVGLCIRCAGQCYKVGFTSFMKDFESGELKLDLPFTVFRHTPMCGFWKDLDDNKKVCAKESAENALKEIFRTAKDENYDLIALDEVLVAVSLGCIDLNLLKELVLNKPIGLEVVMTGAVCPDEILELADYISEINPIRHPFEKGVTARRGIEY